MEEIKTPAPVLRAEAQGLNGNNIVSLSQVRARKKTKFLAVRQSTVHGVGCEYPFLLKQSQSSGKATRWAKRAHTATAGYYAKLVLSRILDQQPDNKEKFKKIGSLAREREENAKTKT